MNIHKNNIEFIKLKDKHGFSIASLAKFLGCSIDTIKSYTSSPDTTRYTVTPDDRLTMLKYKLADKRLKH